MLIRNKWKVIRAILKSLAGGSTQFVACKAAGINDGTLWRWRVADARLDRLIDKVLDVRVKFVEDALYQTALKGSVQAQQYFLNNRARNKWQQAPDVVINTGDDNSKHITQIFQTAPTRILFDDGEGDRKAIDEVPADCALTPAEPLTSGEGMTECQGNRLS